MADETQRVPEADDVQRSGNVETRLARVERALAVDAGEQLPAAREMASRLMMLEGQIHYQAKLTRMTMFVVLIVAVLFFAGTMYMFSQFSAQFSAQFSQLSGKFTLLTSQLGSLAQQRVEDARQLAEAVRLLADIREKMATNPSSVTSKDIDQMGSLVDRILGAENNGFMRNLQIQNQLLDELEGKSPRRTVP